MNFAITPMTLCIAFAMGCIAAYTAHKRGRNIYGWFLIGMFFGLLGLIVAFFIRPKKAKITPQDLPIIPLPPQIIGPSDKFWYYLDPSHEQKGPMSFDAMVKAANLGTIQPNTFVWHEDLPEWKPLQEFMKTPG